MYIYIYMYTHSIYLYTCIRMCIYIYIERERDIIEREREISNVIDVIQLSIDVSLVFSLAMRKMSVGGSAGEG